MTIGFEPTCKCAAGTTSGTVLDMFMGSGTTAQVARYHGRQYVGCDISPKYVRMIQRRLRLPFEIHEPVESAPMEDLPLFKVMA